jgi:hypothetical protein
MEHWLQERPDIRSGSGGSRVRIAIMDAAKLSLVLLLAGSAATAQDLRRAMVWDLKLGQPISAQPSADEFRGFACGSNGGPPRQRLARWSDFARCPAEPSGLHEVYFEYDDELEYVARARDLDREVARWAGTTEMTFPVMVSALFDKSGVLRGIRVVTDPRPDHRDDTVDADLHKREDAYLFGGRMAARFNIDGQRDCTAMPPAEGESAVGTLFIKQSCELNDPEHGRKVLLQVNFFRKRGQSAFNPQQPTQLTTGQFESSARLEVFELDWP